MKKLFTVLLLCATRLGFAAGDEFPKQDPKRTVSSVSHSSSEESNTKQARVDENIIYISDSDEESSTTESSKKLSITKI